MSPKGITRPVPVHDFTLFVVLSFFTSGYSNADRKYSTYIWGTVHEKKEGKKQRKILKSDRPGSNEFECSKYAISNVFTLLKSLITKESLMN